MSGTTVDPERIVKEAEQEEAEAQALAEELTNRVRSGDLTVTAAEVTQQRSLVAFLADKVAGARERAARAREQVRQDALAALRDEIHTTAPESGQHIVELLQAAEEAIAAYLSASDEYALTYDGWRRRLHELEAVDGRLHNGVGMSGSTLGEVRTSTVQLHRLDGARYLNLVLANPWPGNRTILTDDPARRDAVYTELRNIGKEGN